MSLKERLLEDMKVAMRDKDVIKKNTVQMARSAVLQVEKDSRITLDDDGILDVIVKEVKKRRDSLPEFEKSGRQELIDNLKTEIEVLMQYLPKQLTEEELEVIVRQAVQDTGASSAKDMGRIMQEVMPKVKGRADGRMINQIVKKILG
ncbi:MAG: aspartyl-tRNA amidotransferase [Clostridiales bacterium GWC2_40_7]|nr:MAG: aspartyl-tRNA amidotransferase [Clostridiales bacterium GWC2_40_7]